MKMENYKHEWRYRSYGINAELVCPRERINITSTRRRIKTKLIGHKLNTIYHDAFERYHVIGTGRRQVLVGAMPVGLIEVSRYSTPQEESPVGIIPKLKQMLQKTDYKFRANLVLGEVLSTSKIDGLIKIVQEEGKREHPLIGAPEFFDIAEKEGDLENFFSTVQDIQKIYLDRFFTREDCSSQKENKESKSDIKPRYFIGSPPTGIYGYKKKIKPVVKINSPIDLFRQNDQGYPYFFWRKEPQTLKHTFCKSVD